MKSEYCLTVKEVAQITGKSQQWVRVATQLGQLPGIAVKMPNSSKFSYLFTIKQVEEYFGINLKGVLNEEKSV